MTLVLDPAYFHPITTWLSIELDQKSRTIVIQCRCGIRGQRACQGPISGKTSRTIVTNCMNVSSEAGDVPAEFDSRIHSKENTFEQQPVSSQPTTMPSHITENKFYYHYHCYCCCYCWQAIMYCSATIRARAFRANFISEISLSTSSMN